MIKQARDKERQPEKRILIDFQLEAESKSQTEGEAAGGDILLDLYQIQTARNTERQLERNLTDSLLEQIQQARAKERQLQERILIDFH